MEKDNRPVHIEDLNKTQLILLVILLSFVTSIATGVIAATLVEQASPATTQTINRVVQRTIEKVTTESPGETIVQTVVVKEGDLVVDAVEESRQYFFPLKLSSSTETAGAAYSLGNGYFSVSSASIDSEKTYTIVNGKMVYPIKVVATTPYGLSIIAISISDPSVKNFPTIVHAKDTNTKAGATILAVTPTAVAKDIVQMLRTVSVKGEDDTIVASWNSVSIASSLPSAFTGAVVVDLDGTALGFVGKRESGTEIVSAESLLSFVSRNI